MQAARIRRGTTAIKNNLIETKKRCLKSSTGCLDSKTKAIRRPNPREIKTAGSSNIPWGNKRHITDNPSILTVKAKTYPTRAPFTREFINGTKPKSTPKIRPKRALKKLFRKIKRRISKKPLPSREELNSERRELKKEKRSGKKKAIRALAKKRKNTAKIAGREFLR
jgi:hypothetical protein